MAITSNRPKTSHSYFVVMEDFGPRGMEAVVCPETTRRAVVEFIKGGNYRNIVFIHHVDGLFIEDVTEELMGEASFAKAMDAIEDALGDRQAAVLDHARDLRKHEVSA